MKVFFPHSVYRLKNFYNIQMFSWRSKDSCPGLFSYDSTWRYSAYSAPSSNLRDVCGDDAMSQENGVSQNELGYFHLKAVSPQIFEKPLSYAWVCLCQRCFWISMIRDLTIWLKANTSFFFFFSQWNPFSQSIWPIKPLQFYYPPQKKENSSYLWDASCTFNLHFSKPLDSGLQGVVVQPRLSLRAAMIPTRHSSCESTVRSKIYNTKQSSC